MPHCLAIPDKAPFRRYGRKPPLLAGSVVQLVTGVGCALVPWFSVYLCLRFLSAVAVGAITGTGFVLSE